MIPLETKYPQAVVSYDPCSCDIFVKFSFIAHYYAFPKNCYKNILLKSNIVDIQYNFQHHVLQNLISVHKCITFYIYVRPLSLIINIKIIYCGLMPKTKKIVYTNQTLALKHVASNQFIDLRLQKNFMNFFFSD